MFGWRGQFGVCLIGLAIIVVLPGPSVRGQISTGQSATPAFATWPVESEREPTIEDQVGSSIDVADLNLWAPSGRARTFVDRETREALKSVEIIDRPHRPLHFYGNAVRRRHQRDAGSTQRAPNRDVFSQDL